MDTLARYDGKITKLGTAQARHQQDYEERQQRQRTELYIQARPHRQGCYQSCSDAGCARTALIVALSMGPGL